MGILGSIFFPDLRTGVPEQLRFALRQGRHSKRHSAGMAKGKGRGNYEVNGVGWVNEEWVER